MSLIHKKCIEEASSLKSNLEKVKITKAALQEQLKELISDEKATKKDLKKSQKDIESLNALINEIVDSLEGNDKKMIAILSKYGYAQSLVTHLTKIKLLFIVDHEASKRNLSYTINLLPMILKINVSLLKNIELNTIETKSFDNPYYRPRQGMSRKSKYTYITITAKYMGSFTDSLSSVALQLTEKFKHVKVLLDKVEKEKSYAEIKLTSLRRISF